MKTLFMLFQLFNKFNMNINRYNRFIKSYQEINAAAAIFWFILQFNLWKMSLFWNQRRFQRLMSYCGGQESWYWSSISNLHPTKIYEVLNHYQPNRWASIDALTPIIQTRLAGSNGSRKDWTLTANLIEHPSHAGRLWRGTYWDDMLFLTRLYM